MPASNEDGKVVIGAHLPNRQRHAHLRVIALGTTHDAVVGTKDLVEPFLDDGLAVTARDADDRDVELTAVVSRKGLKGLQCVADDDENGAGVVGLRLVTHHKGAHALVVKIGDVSMSVVAGALQGEEQRLGGIHQMAAVDEQVADLTLGSTTLQLPVDDFGDFL